MGILDSKNNAQFGIKFWVISAAVVIIIGGIREMASLITPLFLAMFITAICYGPFVWMIKKGIPQIGRNWNSEANGIPENENIA